MDLGFKIVTDDQGRRVKVRDNGLRGSCIGDEAALWDALQEALASVNNNPPFEPKGVAPAVKGKK